MAAASRASRSVGEVLTSSSPLGIWGGTAFWAFSLPVQTLVQTAGGIDVSPLLSSLTTGSSLIEDLVGLNQCRFTSSFSHSLRHKDLRRKSRVLIAFLEIQNANYWRGLIIGVDRQKALSKLL
jgi:hypothetical protein